MRERLHEAAALLEQLPLQDIELRKDTNHNLLPICNFASRSKALATASETRFSTTLRVRNRPPQPSVKGSLVLPDSSTQIDFTLVYSFRTSNPFSKPRPLIL